MQHTFEFGMTTTANAIAAIADRPRSLTPNEWLGLMRLECSQRPEEASNPSDSFAIRREFGDVEAVRQGASVCLNHVPRKPSETVVCVNSACSSCC
jgi:hypothetical protein